MTFYSPMEKRQSWIDLIERAWKKHSILWLSGVRRAGKTTLCRSLEGLDYYDCELPSVRRKTEDPEDFLASLKPGRLALDEVHRLPDPSGLLKIAADHFPKLQILATGSSTLGASAKFRDSLTGRKSDLWLTPMNSADLVDFGRTNLKDRLLRGGLPPFFMAEEFSEVEYQSWLDSFWARDIQELFRVERRTSFLRFAELLFAQSGGMFEATKFARPCEISRGTVQNYLAILEACHIVHVLRPWSSHKGVEIVSAPKVYAFDTGFVAFARGWRELRPDDCGQLWEHYVLNELQSRLQTRRIQYWRDKAGHEIDFVLAGRVGKLLAVECKWKAAAFDPKAFAPFKAHYPKAELALVAPDLKGSRYLKSSGYWELDLAGLIEMGAS